MKNQKEYDFDEIDSKINTIRIIIGLIVALVFAVLAVFSFIYFKPDKESKVVIVETKGTVAGMVSDKKDDGTRIYCMLVDVEDENGNGYLYTIEITKSDFMKYKTNDVVDLVIKNNVAYLK
jgi:hypothetical protein